MEAAALAPPPAGTIPEAVERVAQAEEASRPTVAAATRASAREMFQFSRYIHIGDGAELCENEGVGCENPEHFHAWCRLPNKFQHKDLHEKGIAAKARMLRRVNDQESDAYAVLENEMDMLRRKGDIEGMIDDLLERDWSVDYLAAINRTEELESFEHITADRERYAELMAAGEDAKSEDEQSDEFRELMRQIAAYLDETKAQLAAIQLPKREAWRALGVNGIVDIHRAHRVDLLADNAFGHAYGEWTWFIGTLQVDPFPAARPHKRMWRVVGSVDDPEPGSMWSAPPEVIEAIETCFHELEVQQHGASAGNS